MNNPKKARKHFNTKLQALLDEVTPLEMEQTKTKVLIAAQIDSILRAKGWSKSLLAEKLSKNPSEITKWLSGTQNFTIDILTQIALVLEVEISRLLSFETKQNQSKKIGTNAVFANPCIIIQTPMDKHATVFIKYVRANQADTTLIQKSN